MKIQKVIKGEIFHFHVYFQLNNMKANVSILHQMNWLNAKYLAILSIFSCQKINFN